MTENQQAHFTVRDRETLTKVETKLDRAIEDIRNLSNSFASKNDVVDLEKRVSSMEDGHKWIVRLVLGVVVLGVLSIVIINR